MKSSSAPSLPNIVDSTPTHNGSAMLMVQFRAPVIPLHNAFGVLEEMN